MQSRGHERSSRPSRGSRDCTDRACQRFWPERWWRWIDYRIGIIPVPIYIVLVGLVARLLYTGEVKSDGATMIAVLALGGFTCAEIGKWIPVLRNIAAAAIFATFIPSALAYYHLIPAKLESSIVEFRKETPTVVEPDNITGSEALRRLLKRAFRALV